MDSKVKVSVVCLAYNHEKYIRDALEGFVRQKTNFNYEVIVHDDASKDASADIIREYEKKYPDIIKPIYQVENQYSKGIGINTTIIQPLVQGEYVAICEGDDYWIDDLKLQKQYDFLSSNQEYSMCVGNTIWHNMTTGKAENKCQIAKDRDITVEEVILESHGRIFQTSSVMIKTDVWKCRPEWRKKFPIGDYPLAILAGLCGKIHMIADDMSVYRWNVPGSWTNRMAADDKRASISRKMIEALLLLDESTEYKYSDVIADRIKKHRYTLALMEHDLNTIRKGELKDMYKSRSIAHKVSDVFRCKFPGIYTMTRKLIGK